MSQQQYPKLTILALATLVLLAATPSDAPSQSDLSRVQVVVLQGSPYQRGLTHGQKLKDQIHAILRLWKADLEKQYKTEIDAFVKQFLAKTDFLPAIRKWTPELLDEVKGIAEGAGVPFDTMLVFQLVDEYWVQGQAAMNEKCSSLGISKRGDKPACIAQNVDVETFRDSFQIVLHIKHQDTGLESFVLTCAGMIGVNGMNNRAIGICCNTLMALTNSRDGLPVACIVRGVLSQQTEADAVNFLHKIKHASGQNYILGGPDKAYCFECSATRVTQFQPPGQTDRVWHTNHPLANDDYLAAYREGLKRNPNRKPGNSEVRLKCLETRLGKPDADWSFNTIRDTLSSKDSPDHPVCVPKTKRSGFTFASTIMILNPDAPQLHIAPGPPDITPFEKLTFGTPNKR